MATSNDGKGTGPKPASDAGKLLRNPKTPGISISTAERWSQWAKRDWAAYVGQCVADDREDIDSPKPAKQTL